jgi:hypothetical protein
VAGSKRRKDGGFTWIWIWIDRQRWRREPSWCRGEEEPRKERWWTWEFGLLPLRWLLGLLSLYLQQGGEGRVGGYARPTYPGLKSVGDRGKSLRCRRSPHSHSFQMAVTVSRCGRLCGGNVPPFSTAGIKAESSSWSLPTFQFVFLIHNINTQILIHI